MNRKTSLVVLLLLAMTLALTGAMMPEQAQAAKALAGCKVVGCAGGPDACLSLTVVVNGVTVGLHCYSRFPVPQ